MAQTAGAVAASATSGGDSCVAATAGDGGDSSAAKIDLGSLPVLIDPLCHPLAASTSTAAEGAGEIDIVSQRKDHPYTVAFFVPLLPPLLSYLLLHGTSAPNLAHATKHTGLDDQSTATAAAPLPWKHAVLVLGKGYSTTLLPPCCYDFIIEQLVTYLCSRIERCCSPSSVAFILFGIIVGG